MKSGTKQLIHAFRKRRDILKKSGHFGKVGHHKQSEGMTLKLRRKQMGSSSVRSQVKKAFG